MLHQYSPRLNLVLGLIASRTRRPIDRVVLELGLGTVRGLAGRSIDGRSCRVLLEEPSGGTLGTGGPGSAGVQRQVGSLVDRQQTRTRSDSQRRLAVRERNIGVEATVNEKAGCRQPFEPE
jgi:hypothetical protein